ncbi:glycosyltransferase family 2 protein [Megamonas sp.]|uniref:glycosyltransferase n=1 Tax=Megamonas sp. TaxID=2049033 RepID=UPI00257F93DF|nr:glycosyltransferase family 2 protein [Megamonas sp.]MBS5780312.1 glycosyltransferase family 2 protein [Megamonas sp.]
MNIQLIIPIYKPDNKFLDLLRQIKKQTIKNISLLIIDSGSNDKYKNEIKDMNCLVKKIDAKTFNHGGTRQMGADMFPDKDIYIYLTQDAILADEYAINNIVKVFDNDNIGCAYGRQLPHKGATIFAIHARLFNYKNKSYIYTIKDKEKYGMKTAFNSNSFAAYRRKALKDVGGFPTDTILSEDMYVTAKMLLKNWSVAYCAEAKVYHSHNYTIWQEFKRYFDIGVFHAREEWIREVFGKAEGEGINFVISEVKMLIKNNPLLLFDMFFRDAMKFLGYRLGIKEKYISVYIKQKISMNKKFWNERINNEKNKI